MKRNITVYSFICSIMSFCFFFKKKSLLPSRDLNKLFFASDLTDTQLSIHFASEQERNW